MGLSRRKALLGAAGIGLLASMGARARTHFDKDEFIDAIRRANRESDPQPAVQEVLRKTVSAPGSVVRGLGEPSVAGLHTLYRDPSLTILNVTWAPLMVLFPHEHRMWATIGVYGGREDNIIWQRAGESIRASQAASLTTRDVFSLPWDAVHSVVNPIRKLTGAIHVYGGDFFDMPRKVWDPETLEARPWDPEEAQAEFRAASDRFNRSR